MNSFRVYFHFIKMGFMEFMAFRITIFMLGFSILITLFARYYIFKAVYESPDDIVGGYDLRSMLTYLVVAWLLRSFFRSGVDRRIGGDVRRGNIVFDLLRPINYYMMTMMRAFGKSANRFVFASMPLIFLFLLTDILMLPGDWQTWAAFLTSVLLAYLIAFQTQFFIGILSFYTGYNMEIVWTFDMITQLLAGLILPLHFFPEAAAKLLLALPFRHIFYTPAQVYLGEITPSEYLALIPDCLMWIFILGVINYLTFRQGRRSLTIAGG